MFQVEIIVSLNTFAKSVGKVSRNEGKAESAAKSDNEKVVGHGKFTLNGNGLHESKSPLPEVRE